MTEQTTQTQPDFAALLKTVTTEPGVVSKAYFAFHGYSLGNQLLAMFQCMERGIAIGPIATYKRWAALGRQVQKGSKAIELCMPVTRKFERENKETGEKESGAFTRFIYRRNWFVLAQTEGAEFVAPSLPAWDRAKALSTLGVTEIPFDLTDGNCQGFAREQSIAINPVAEHPLKTTFHEIAHVILGHTAEGKIMGSHDRTSRDVRELEAESTAMLVCAALGLPGVEEARGYVQHWFAGKEVPEQSARKIFKAATSILQAGQPVQATAEAE